jgi:hypothetical protein
MHRMTLFVWQKHPKQRNELLYNCSEFDKQNDDWVEFPIGMSWQFVNYPEPINNAFLGDHVNLVLCAIKDHTDQRRRGSSSVNRCTILNSLRQNGIQNVHMDSTAYFSSLPQYKFVISPEGNGIDCHRHYEALMAGCIPIVEENPDIRYKYRGCPVLFTKDYSEITPDYLASVYKKMSAEVYNFSYLYLSSYAPMVQRQIKENGNYWGQRVAGKEWYPSVETIPDEKPTSSVCAVFLCNKPYFGKFLSTCVQLLTNGNYRGPICLVIGDDLKGDPCLQHPLIVNLKIHVQYFPIYNYSNNFLYIQSKMDRAPHWPQKLFQYHKFYLFHPYFKQYDYIFYMDCGLTIFSDVTPILNERKPNTLLAHSDTFPAYDHRLDFQFETNNIFFDTLVSTHNLSVDYFQTTIMLYDTQLIEPNTVDDLYKLLFEYPISITNDQGIIALYFASIRPRFEQIRIKNNTTYFYDYMSRNPANKYIMLKAVEEPEW